MVKSEDDVLVVDVCNKVGGSPGEQPVRLYRNGNLTEGTKIYQDNDGKLITVELPTAGFVMIQTEKNNRLSVFVVPSSLDWLRSEGLCGVYDGNKNNDMAMPVTGNQPAKWRISSKDGEIRQETVCIWEHQLIHHTSPQCTAPVVGTAAWSRTTANPCSYPTPALSTQGKTLLLSL